MRLAVLSLVLIAVAVAYFTTRHAPPPSPDPTTIAAATIVYPRVADAAGLLDPFGATLSRMADAFNTDLGIDVHVVTTTESAASIEAQAEQVFRERRIGVDAHTGGLLLLLNSRLQRARVEVSYTLEGGLTDLQVAEIARDQLTPYAASGIAGMAVMDALHYLRDLVYVAAARGQIELGGTYGRDPRIAEYRRYFSGGAGARTTLTASGEAADLKARIPDPGRARYAPGTDPQESLEAYLRATAELAGDPSLELFTPGSRLMRAVYPFARFEELQRLERMERSRPLRLERRGDFAVATSERPATGFVPVLLRRDAEDLERRNPPLLFWRVDAVETWKNLFFSRDGNYFLKNTNTAYSFGLSAFGQGRDFDIRPLAVPGKDPAAAISALENDKAVLASLLRGEIWFRNAFVPLRAFAAYRDALDAAPRDPLVLETMGRRALYIEMPDLSLPALSRMRRGAEWLLMEAHQQAGDSEAALSWAEKAMAENPYDPDGLRWREFLQRRLGREADAQQTTRELARLTADRGKPGQPVTLAFSPVSPVFHAETVLKFDGTTVYDHSEFAVTMTNTSRRAVEIQSVSLYSEGDDRASGLGDVTRYWRFPSGGKRLAPGESVTFNKTWGFTTDTGHHHVRYIFRTCWRGLDSGPQQCRTQHVDVLPAWFIAAMTAETP